MSGLSRKPQGQSLGSAGEGSFLCIYFPKSKPWQIMGAVNFLYIFLIKKFTAGRRACAGLLGGLEQKEYVSPRIPPFPFCMLQ